VGMVLGNQNINIATLHLGRDRFGGNAISLVHLDAPLPPGTVREILRIPNIISVRQISL
jgi:D-3-phosphoglycerate dehydrogenase